MAHERNTPFAPSLFDFKIINFHTSYSPYTGQNDTRYSSKGRGKDNEFEYSFLIICRDLNFVKKNQRII